MRLRRASPLLLLLLPAFAHADLSPPHPGARLQKRDGASDMVDAAAGKLSQAEILAMNVVPGAAVGRGKVTQKAAVADGTTTGTRPTASTRAYKGTEDAPVDGLDGKPHAGPFVDTTPEESESEARKAGGAAGATATPKAKPKALEMFSDQEDIPEKIDGVMNDETRVAPKKGTTGTEGGISEKDKERKAKGEAIGMAEKKPESPKEERPLPHSEQERIASAEQDKTGVDGSSKQVSSKDVKTGGEKDAATSGEKKDGYGVGGYGMDKPSDLPDKPHNIPHPDPKGPSMPADKADGPPITGKSEGSWLQETMPYTEGSVHPKKLLTKLAPDGSVVSVGTAGAGEMEWHEWFHSFVLSYTMILVSEIGDKTFLIAALMAMRHARLLVFSAALSALIAMTVLSAVLGHVVPTLLPKRFTTFAAAILFLVFGARMLREGLAMPHDLGVGEEMKEVEAELEEKEHQSRDRSNSTTSPYNLESGRGRKPSTSSSRSPSPSRPSSSISGLTNLVSLVLSPAWVQTFIMTFLGEWGDRSQIATIAMAAGQDYWWVTLGAVAGHACCTGLAVVGGRALAGRVSLRVVTIGGALAFLVFGVIYLYECATEGSA